MPVQLRPPVPYLHLLPIIDVLKAPNYGAFFCSFFALMSPGNIFLYMLGSFSGVGLVLLNSEVHAIAFLYGCALLA